MTNERLDIWERIDRRGPDDCWPWKLSLNAHGYGIFGFAGTTERAHRVVYILTHGPIPTGLVVRHRCDNRACCNPVHLELGTQGENIRDMDDRGRRRTRTIRGAAHVNAKLTSEQIAAIRAEWHAGVPNQYVLADKYGISQQQVSRIINKQRRAET